MNNAKLTLLAHIIGAYAKGWSVVAAFLGVAFCFFDKGWQIGLVLVIFAQYLLNLSCATKGAVGES